MVRCPENSGYLKPGCREETRQDPSISNRKILDFFSIQVANRKVPILNQRFLYKFCAIERIAVVYEPLQFFA